MPILRTFYWHKRLKHPVKLFINRRLRGRNWTDFRHGNAGDIFARDLLEHTYPGVTTENVEAPPRLLCVGSISHKLLPGDVLSGVGCKTDVLPPEAELPRDSVHIHALRGPISLEIFRKAGFDVSGVKFLADPGVLLGRMVPERDAIPGRVIFIPHYRERREARQMLPEGITMVDIDAKVPDLARRIQEAELVYSSSLHGIIFAHALGRPCVFVRPMTEEPLAKFEDYFLAVGLDLPVPLGSIAEADLAAAPVSPATLKLDLSEVVLPARGFLEERGILA